MADYIDDRWSDEESYALVFEII
ncbi:hypothetical protein VTL71DRAFT_9437 [Oculimacula yallundae]|uniref:Uncharacterized protein n=1 Tax=Oculimacula yallundae TaxID=86028 RepID=A0ABR4BSR2_9HELO